MVEIARTSVEASEAASFEPRQNVTVMVLDQTFAQDEYHLGYMGYALSKAEEALMSNETPVGCVFVHRGTIIGSAKNATNASLSGTRHAELVAITEILRSHPASVFAEADLYVTVEPCIMCAAALRQLRIRAVFYGCANDRFGGTTGVLSINADIAVDPSYPVYGGLFAEQAVQLLQRFYVNENENAPESRKRNKRLSKPSI